jgi:phosphoesterase RecJ-like protein
MSHAPAGRTPEQALALDALRGGRRFLLAGHQRPDGDCLGAQAALAGVLRALGKEVWIVNPDPPEPRYAYLERATEFRTWRGESLPAHDWTVLLDISELSRCGPLEAPLRAAPSKKLVVDHHVHAGEAWWDAAYVDVRASATGLLVWRIARELGAPIDGATARALFTSLVTDTGWFKYSNTDAETLRAASELVQLGAEPARLFDALHQRQRPEQPLALGRALARAEYLGGGRLAWVAVPAAGSADAEALDGDVLLDLLRAVERVEVVLYVRERADGGCKVSARSKTDCDVQALLRAFGGGGHAKAAGATITGGLAAVRERLVAAALAHMGIAPAEARPGAESGGRGAPRAGGRTPSR